MATTNDTLAVQMRTVAKARREYAKQMTAAAGDERLPLEHNTSWVMADALDAFADAADRAAAEASAREAAYQKLDAAQNVLLAAYRVGARPSAKVDRALQDIEQARVALAGKPLPEPMQDYERENWQ